jgi:hypothetical protein
MARKNAQRRFVRMPFRREGTLGGPLGLINVDLEDLSLNGVRLKLEDHLPGPEDALYRLSVELAPGLQVRMGLRVVHRRGFNVGLQCRRIDRQSLACVKRVLALYYGEGSEAMEKEVSRLEALIRDDRRPGAVADRVATPATPANASSIAGSGTSPSGSVIGI